MALAICLLRDTGDEMAAGEGERSSRPAEVPQPLDEPAAQALRATYDLLVRTAPGNV